MLKSLFNDFLEDLAKDAVKLINKFLVDLMDIALNCQNYISTKHLIKGLSLSKVNAVILKYAIALLILKFVQKGFSIYILQSDGDPDHDPIHILTGFCQAVAISVTFLGLYTPLVNIFETFTKAILTAIGSKGEIEAIKDQFLLTLFGNGITTVLLLIIFNRDNYWKFNHIFNYNLFDIYTDNQEWCRINGFKICYSTFKCRTYG